MCCALWVRRVMGMEEGAKGGLLNQSGKNKSRFASAFVVKQLADNMLNREPTFR